MADALLSSDLGSLPLLARGKVRDIYAVSDAPVVDLVFIATDRISAFDHLDWERWSGLSALWVLVGLYLGRCPRLVWGAPLALKVGAG